MFETLSLVDWLVLGGYAWLVIFIGVRAGRGHQSAEEMALGGRQMPAWAVFCSLFATELSAATFIGVPQASYSGDWTYLQFAFGALAGKLILSVTFIPLYHRLGVVTVYGFIEQRFGAGAHRATAFFFVLGRLLASGVRLYIAALAFSVVTGTSVSVAIGICGVLAGLYTLWGGIRAVIWTDTLQGLLFIIAAIATIVVLVTRIDGGFAGIWDWAAAQGRDVIFVFPPLQAPEGTGAWQHLHEMFIADGRAFWVALVGGCFLSLATHATDHDMVQRLLTTKNGRSGSAALVGSALLNFPLSATFLFIGTGLAVFYANGASYDLGDGDRIFALFAVNELPSGLRGLMFAGLFAAAMSSLDSAICAIATTCVVDLFPRFDGKFTRLQLTRLFTVGTCAALVAVALGCEAYRNSDSGEDRLDLVAFALAAMMPVYGGLLGVFLVGFVTKKRGNSVSVLLGLLGGVGVGLALFAQKQLGLVLDEKVLVAWPWWIVLGAVVSFSISILGRSKAEQ